MSPVDIEVCKFGEGGEMDNKRRAGKNVDGIEIIDYFPLEKE